MECDSGITACYRRALSDTTQHDFNDWVSRRGVLSHCAHNHLLARAGRKVPQFLAWAFILHIMYYGSHGSHILGFQNCNPHVSGASLKYIIARDCLSLPGILQSSLYRLTATPSFRQRMYGRQLSSADFVSGSLHCNLSLSWSVQPRMNWPSHLNVSL